MDYAVLIQQIFTVVLIPLLSVLTTFVVKFIQKKANEIDIKIDNELADKYIKMVSDTIIECVIATNQTYSNSLKEQGKFDAEAQKIAFEKTFNAVLAILSDEAKEYISSITGDINVYLTQLIESAVNKNRAI